MFKAAHVASCVFDPHLFIIRRYTYEAYKTRVTLYGNGVAAAEGFSTSNAGVEGFYISFSGGTPCETCDTTTVGGKTVCKNHKEIRFFANATFYQTYHASKDGDGWIGSPESYIVGYAVDTEATVDNAAAYVYEIAIAKTALDGGIGANMAFELVYINASAGTDWVIDGAYSWSQAADYKEVPGWNQNSGMYSNTAGFAPVALEPETTTPPEIEIPAEPTLDPVAINATNFPDEAFRTFVAENYDDDNDGILSGLERGGVAFIDVPGTYGYIPGDEFEFSYTWTITPAVNDLTGIEYFPNLLTLNCSYNNLKSLDVSKNTKLDILRCSGNDITELDLSKNVSLDWLIAENCLLTELDLSNCPELSHLNIRNGYFLWAAGGGGSFKNYNKLTSLDLSKNTNLQGLYCTYNALESLDLSKNKKLTELDCSANALTTLDLSANTALSSVSCSANPLSTLTLGTLPELAQLSCNGTDLTTLDVRGCTALQSLECHANELTALNLQSEALLYLGCGYNPLTTLDLSGVPNLESLACYDAELTEIDVSMLEDLFFLNVSNNLLTEIDVSKNLNLVDLVCGDNLLTELDVSANTKLRRLDLYRNQLTSLDVSTTAVQLAGADSNKYAVTATGGIFNLNTLPGNFDAKKASNWNGCIATGNMIIVTGLGGTVTYDYDIGNDQIVTFTLEVKNIPTTTGGTTTGGTTTGGTTTGGTTAGGTTGGSASTPAEPWVNPYSDVADDHPNIDAIAYVTEKGIFKGTDANNPTFSEEVVLTRAQFVTILGRLAEVDMTEYTAQVFSDVDPAKTSDAWFAPYVAWANENGIIYGYTDGTFGPNDEITVEQAITILGRFARYQEKYSVSLKKLDAFEDADTVSSWALADMQWAVEKGIYTGAEGSLEPKALTDRLLTAILVYFYDIIL